MPIKSCPLTIDAHNHEIDNRGTPMFPCGGYATTVGSHMGKGIAWHWHDEVEALIVCRGTLTLELVGRCYEICEGEGAFINSGVLQSAVAARETSCEIRSLVFHPRLIAGMPESALEQRYVRPLLECSGLPGIHFKKDIPWHKEAIQCIAGAFDAYQSEAFGYELLVRQRLSQLWYLIIINHRHMINNSVTINADALRLKDMLAFIHTNYAEPLTLLDIAKAASISERECLRCFKRAIGLSPMKYVLNQRISVAAGLLAETDQTVTEIRGGAALSLRAIFP